MLKFMGDVSSSFVNDNFLLAFPRFLYIWRCLNDSLFSIIYSNGKVQRANNLNRINFSLDARSEISFCRLKKILFSYYRHFHTFFSPPLMHTTRMSWKFEISSDEQGKQNIRGKWKINSPRLEKIKSCLSRAGADDFREWRRIKKMSKATKSLVGLSFFFGWSVPEQKMRQNGEYLLRKNGKCCWVVDSFTSAISYDNSSWNILRKFMIHSNWNGIYN